MKLTTIAACVFVATTAMATEVGPCPTLKPLTCDQLKAKVAARCPVETPTPRPEVPVVSPPKGTALFRTGLMYLDGPGANVGGGYRFANGIDLVGTVGYKFNHGDDIEAYQKVERRGCPRYVPVVFEQEKGNAGIGFDITIPLPFKRKAQ